MHPLLTVIIPVWNTPPTFLTRCLESVGRQEPQDLEVLLIDDGSRENLSRTYTALVQADPRIHYWKTPHQGASAARNLGLDHARGRWITFLEAGDALEPGFLARGMEFARRQRLDIVSTGCRLIPPGKRSLYAHPQEAVLWSMQPLLRSLLNQSDLRQWGVEARLLGYCWGKLYRAAVIRNLRFPAHISYREDICFNLQSVAAAKRIGFATDIDYRFSYRPPPYRPDAEQAVAAYLAFCRDFAKGRDPLLTEDCAVATVYGYLEHLKMTALHREAPGDRAIQLQSIRSTFYRDPWVTAFNHIDPYTLPIQYRALRSAYLRRWPEGVRLLHRVNELWI